MKSKIILDTGPLVAYLSQNDVHHAWAKSQFTNIQAPIYTCESVISETCFLLRRFLDARKIIFEWMHQNIIQIPFNLKTEIDQVRRLMERYKTVPMSLADACLVRMGEQIQDSYILTIDKDFLIYKKHGRYAIPNLMPSF